MISKYFYSYIFLDVFMMLWKCSSYTRACGVEIIYIVTKVFLLIFTSDDGTLFSVTCS